MNSNTRLGLIGTEGNWDYIFFGNNFNRELQYISDKEFYDKDILQILADNDLDGLLIEIEDDKKEDVLKKANNTVYHECPYLEDVFLLFKNHL